jgi:uncharacterized protein (UPF0147 family)
MLKDFTEKNLRRPAASDQTAMIMVEETLTLRATTVTGLLKEIPGWQHNGLND